MLKKKLVKFPNGVGWKGSGFVKKKISLEKKNCLFVRKKLAKNVHKSWKTCIEYI